MIYLISPNLLPLDFENFYLSTFLPLLRLDYDQNFCRYLKMMTIDIPTFTKGFAL